MFKLLKISPSVLFRFSLTSSLRSSSSLSETEIGTNDFFLSSLFENRVGIP